MTIWQILKDITLAQALKHLFAMPMAENSDMEAHVQDSTPNGEPLVQLTDIPPCRQSFFVKTVIRFSVGIILYMPTGYSPSAL